MLKKNLLHFLFFLILFSCQKTESIQQPVNRKAIADSAVVAFQKKIYKTQIDSIVNQYHFNGSVGVFKDTIELYRRNNGFADFVSKRKINDSTIFSIASISKQFTAVLILLKMEEGKLTLDDKASKYIKDFKKKEYENITIRQLLNHSSGLNNFGEKLLFKSGSGFNYSNDGFNALGKIVETVSGKSFDENMIELLKKAGMKNSSTGTSFTGENFAKTHVGNLKNQKPVDNMPKRLGNKEIGIAAGGVLSTINDLLIWNNALYSGKIIKPETLKKFMSKSTERQHPILGKMGYGLGIMMNDNKPVSYFHSGYVKGAPSLNIYYPETKTSVIILSNIADEEKGKSASFRPHLKIKEIADILENIN
ncbi:serine hydrolase domain-containing protein [Chryseobacterium indoltheticum]|uniref:serine hydrolase domain-containing protein n=1 Tax=Chryseobacterium indoltheticum TaxID=254 RepID=UPI0019114E96|nr:serine hydrolase domain-containing protein [Chryseobacterium indoltheticum]QQQ27473.1 beta-lactamase family protein [Chryseobacterium indoltheticum]